VWHDGRETHTHHRTPQAVARTKFVVTLTDEERAFLTTLVMTGRAPAWTRAHARVLLKADAAPGDFGWTDEQIRDALGISLTTIARIRRTCIDRGWTRPCIGVDHAPPAPASSRAAPRHTWSREVAPVS
jgi:hypothetical protein